MGWRSSVRGDFVYVKTVVGLERFEVGKSLRSYNVPFRSYNFELEKNRSFAPSPRGQPIEKSFDTIEGLPIVNQSNLQMREKPPWSHQLTFVESKAVLV